MLCYTQNRNYGNLIIVQFLIIFVLSLSYIFGGFLFSFSENILIPVLTLLFIWTFLSLGFVKMPFYHPYRLYLLIFFLYNLGAIIYLFFTSSESFFSNPNLFPLTPKDFYTEEVKRELLYSLMFFLAFLHLGVLWFSYRNKTPVLATKTSPEKEKQRKKLEKIGIYIFYISLIPCYYFFYIMLYEVVYLGGYRGIYGAETRIGTTDLNILVRLSDNTFIFGYLLFLATLPKIKKTILPTILYIIPFLLVAIFAGQRVVFFSQLIVIFTYFALFSKISTKKAVLFLALFFCAASLLGIFRIVQDFNFQRAIQYFSKDVPLQLERFYLSQGASAHTIGLTISDVKKGEISHSLRFLYLPLRERSGYNLQKQEADYYFLANRLAFRHHPHFNEGAGYGSSIVAEFYVYGGMLAICFFAFLFGFFLMWLTRGLNNPLKLLLLLLLLGGTYYTARSHVLTGFLFARTELIFALLLLFAMPLIRRLKIP